MLIDFQNLFIARFTGEYPTQPSLIIPPHLKRVAVVPCEHQYRKTCENVMYASLSTTNHEVV